jgi:long-chain acyl-CoA synthetase
VQRMLAREVSALTSVEAGFNPHESVRRIHVLAAPFSVEDGTLTHTLKLRRNVVLERFASVLQAWQGPRTG